MHDYSTISSGKVLFGEEGKVEIVSSREPQNWLEVVIFIGIILNV